MSALRRIVLGKVSLLLAFVLLLALSPLGQAVAHTFITGYDIIDGSIQPRDLAKSAVTRVKIKHNAVNGSKIANGSINTQDIANGAITGAKIAPGLNADMVDGKHASDFAGAGHEHDVAYAAINHAHDSVYALIGHDHNSTYSPLGHSHDTSYSAINHDHDSRYYTETESDARYATSGHSHDATKTGVLIIPAAAFREHGAYTFDLEDGFAYGTGSGYQYIDAPAVFPNGSEIKDMSFDIYDNSGSYDTRIDLYRWSPSTGAEILGEAESSSTSASWQKLTANTFSNPIIDNSAFSNSLEVRLHGPSGTNIMVGTGRITYEYRD